MPLEQGSSIEVVSHNIAELRHAGHPEKQSVAIALKEVGQSRSDSGKKRCAGIIFRAPGPVYLLVKRSDTGEWEQPGGHLEGEETPEQAAIRECREEIGQCPDGFRWPLRMGETPELSYVTFVQDVPEPFAPKLNSEHLDYVWSGLPPDGVGMHPEVYKSLTLLTGHETDMAKRIAAGEVLSPQPFLNIWLFDVRVTGTGTAYRPAEEEFVYRPPENFLSEEFLERCNGLPLIFEHPKSKILTSQEFRDRVIGTVVLPYIKGDEVWGIAKVFDADAVPLMQETHPSTSPAVVFRDAGSTETVEVDGKTVLIEGKPKLLDHLAICPVGVWDKGGEPAGINIGDPIMEEKKEEKRADAEMPAWADALVKKVDGLCSRMDSLEKPAEELKADKKADSLEEKKEEKKAEGASKEEKKAEEKALEEGKKEEKAEKKAEESRADSVDVKALQSQMAALQAQLAGVTAPLSAQDRDALAAAQARADGLAQMFGDSVTPPLHGESPIAYRKRLATRFQKHSAQFKDVKLDSIEGPTFDLVERTIYADAQTAALNPAAAPEGRLIAIKEDIGGRTVTRFTGDIAAWMTPFMSPGQNVRILRQNARA